MQRREMLASKRELYDSNFYDEYSFVISSTVFLMVATYILWGEQDRNVPMYTCLFPQQYLEILFSLVSDSEFQLLLWLIVLGNCCDMTFLQKKPVMVVLFQLYGLRFKFYSPLFDCYFISVIWSFQPIIHQI